MLSTAWKVIDDDIKRRSQFECDELKNRTIYLKTRIWQQV